MSESIVTGVFTLLGVIIGGLMNYGFTWFLERKRWKNEVKALTICEYEKLCEELRKYLADFISHKELADYYYNQYRAKEVEIRSKQSLYFTKKQKAIVKEVDNYTWKLIEEEKISQLFKKIQTDIGRL